MAAGGGTQQGIVSALASLGADDLDPTGLSAHIATITSCLDTWRTVGLNIYRTFFDAMLGRLLIAHGQPDQACSRLNMALRLANDTGMHFYDAELLRRRAHTHTDLAARQADVSAALALARRQGATLFERAPPSTISSSVANPRATLWSTPSAASPPTARLRNWRQPKHYFRELTRTMQVGRKPDRHSY